MEKRKFYRDLKSGKFANMVKENVKGEMINNSSELFNIMKPLMSKHDDVEQFWIMYLNSKNDVLELIKMSSGSIGGVYIYPREIIKKALKVKATAIICCHNHPSGDPLPSPEDFLI